MMQIHLHIANVNVTVKDDTEGKAILGKLDSIIQNQHKMGQNTDKALADLQEINDKLTKISTESSTLLQKITDLENAAANADTPQSVLDKIAEVKAQAIAVDDLVPDAPPAGSEGTGDAPQG